MMDDRQMQRICGDLGEIKGRLDMLIGFYEKHVEEDAEEKTNLWKAIGDTREDLARLNGSSMKRGATAGSIAASIVTGVVFALYMIGKAKGWLP